MAEDEVARVRAQRAEVVGGELKLWMILDSLDVMGLEVFRSPARDARRLSLKVLAAHASPRARAAEEIVGLSPQPSEHQIAAASRNASSTWLSLRPRAAASGTSIGWALSTYGENSQEI